MGLTSLPILNKMGYGNYWYGLWYTNFDYSGLLLQNLYVELFFNVWVTDRFFSTRYLKTRKFQIYTSLLYKKIYFVNVRRSVMVGDVWFLRYQGWVVLSPVFFSDYRRGDIGQVSGRFLHFSLTAGLFKQLSQML